MRAIATIEIDLSSVTLDDQPVETLLAGVSQMESPRIIPRRMFLGTRGVSLWVQLPPDSHLAAPTNPCSPGTQHPQ